MTTKTKFQKIQIPYKVGATPISRAQALTFLSEADIQAGQKNGDLKTHGIWQLPVSYTALAINHAFNEIGENKPITLTIWGHRTLSKPRQSGHELEGRVSVDGKQMRAFTSSMLFDVEGTLVDVAVNFVCNRE